MNSDDVTNGEKSLIKSWAIKVSNRVVRENDRYMFRSEDDMWYSRGAFTTKSVPVDIYRGREEGYGKSVPLKMLPTVSKQQRDAGEILRAKGIVFKQESIFPITNHVVYSRLCNDLLFSVRDDLENKKKLLLQEPKNAAIKRAVNNLEKFLKAGGLSRAYFSLDILMKGGIIEFDGEDHCESLDTIRDIYIKEISGLKVHRISLFHMKKNGIYNYEGDNQKLENTLREIIEAEGNIDAFKKVNSLNVSCAGYNYYSQYKDALTVLYRYIHDNNPEKNTSKKYIERFYRGTGKERIPLILYREFEKVLEDFRSLQNLING